MNFINLDENILDLTSEDLLKEILKYENINLIKIDGTFLIFTFIFRNKFKVLKKLIQHCIKIKTPLIDINIQNSDLYTPLHYLYVNIKNSKLILKYWYNFNNIFDINIKNCHGDTPLHVVCGGGNIEILKLLLRNDSSHVIEIDSKNSCGETPLHRACIHGNIKVVEFLFEYVQKEGLCSPDINNKNNINGETPLWSACRDGYLETIEFLLRKGAKIEYDEDGNCKYLKNTYVFLPQETRDKMYELIFSYTSSRFKKART